MSSVDLPEYLGHFCWVSWLCFRDGCENWKITTGSTNGPSGLRLAFRASFRPLLCPSGPVVEPCMIFPFSYPLWKKNQDISKKVWDNRQIHAISQRSVAICIISLLSLASQRQRGWEVGSDLQGRYAKRSNGTNADGGPQVGIYKSTVVCTHVVFVAFFLYLVDQGWEWKFALTLRIRSL